MSPDKFKEITDWLVDGARSAPTPSGMMAECCERLVAAGLPLYRVGVFIRTLHPEIFGRNFIWRPDTGVAMSSVDFDIQSAPEFLASPLATVFLEGAEVRSRLDLPSSKPFPFFDDMRAEGVTDYIAIPLTFVDNMLHASSWTTKQPGGFSDEQLAALKSVLPTLARLIEVIGMRRVSMTLLDTYVGNRAGGRILGGQIRRGHTETMHAAIWLSDLRGFTALSDRLPPESVVEILNGYFDCQVPAILAHGGEVLKFMGDGLLAVFPIAEDDADLAIVCRHALAAAQEAAVAVEALRWSDAAGIQERFRFGLALHVGRVLYGNIGGGNRLDFTCIGPAVNLAARLEKIAGKLHRTIVASGTFADAATADWTDLGEFPIAGFAKAERVYGLADESRPLTPSSS
jgi:adenylate cyclase